MTSDHRDQEITWTIGATGLLGSALVRRQRRRFDPGPIDWHDPSHANRQLIDGVRQFATVTEGRPWRILWTAGNATVSTTAEQTRGELSALQALTSGIGEFSPAGPGTIFLASSAGGVYAGSSHAPFDRGSTIAPISPYGHLKAAQESAIGVLASRHSVVIGRIANLYGPSQRLNKSQGLISLLVQAAATRQSLNVFVPLDTLRDYIFVEDAAAAIDIACERARDPGVTVEVIASGRSQTVGHLIRLVEVVTKRKVPVARGQHASAQLQVRDLRLVPSITLEDPTSLPTGIHTIFADTLARLQGTRLSA